MTRPAILERLRGVQKAGDGWTAFCPAHDDKNKRSLSVGIGDNGRTLLRCHAQGCAVEAIVAAVGMEMRDLAPVDAGPAPSRSRVVKRYDYTDGAGVLLYQVERLEPKAFRQRRPDGHGGWIYKVRDVRRVLYRMPDLAEQRRVVWAEGEKEVDRLAGLGIPSTTSAGGAKAFRDDYADELQRLGVEDVVIIPDNDVPGRDYAAAVARACQRRGLRARVLHLPGLPPVHEKHGEDASDWLDAGHDPTELVAQIERAPAFVEQEATAVDHTPTTSAASGEGQLERHGFDLALSWVDGVRFDLSAIRDGREGVRGELTVTIGARRLHWGALALPSTSSRESVRKKLEAIAPGLTWADRLEEAAWTFTQARRAGEPIVALSGLPASPTRELIPRLLYEGESTLIYADGDTGKSLFAQAVAVAVHSGAALPNDLKPARPAVVAYMDYETAQDSLEERTGLVAAGLCIDPPGVLYKRMVRPLVDEAAALAVEFAARNVGLVIVDSQMFALAGGEGTSPHEPITNFYTALRLFAPAACLVLSHVTGADARGDGPTRPYGGAFAYNGPRLVWEMKRDRDITDATAIVFTCKKANNLARRPEPFGLRFTPGVGTITIAPFDLAEAAPQAVVGAGLVWRLRLALSRGARTVEALAEELGAAEDSVRKTLNRYRSKGTFVAIPNTKPQEWGMGDTR